MIIIGVVAGPGTMACVQRGDFAACMSETFLGTGSTQIAESDPAQDVASLADAPAAQSTPETEEAEQSEAVGAGETAMSVSQAVMPSFALVRVEPDGSAVIAGTASPSGEVRIFADNTEIGTETAEPSGDFAFVTTEPLPTGGVELRVLDVETDTYASTSVVVVVQDDRTSEPLVVASEPGEASEILQGLEAPAEPVEIAEAEPQVPVETIAEAEPEIQPETTPAAEPEAPEAVAEAEPETLLEPEPVVIAEAEEPAPMAVAEAEIEPEAPASASDAQEVPATVTPPAEAPTPAEPAAETPGTPAAQTAVVPAAEPALDVPAPQVQTPAPAEIASDDLAPDAPAPQEPAAPVAVTEPEAPRAIASDPAPAVEPETPARAPAAAEEPVAAATPIETAQPEAPALAEQLAGAAAIAPVAVVQPTIDAVEIDGDRNFFAGAGTDGMTVRLYVDNDLVGTTEVVDGRWLVETIGELDQASQRVRIDMLEDGVVVGRAEVDFVLELPQAMEDEIAVAENSEPEVSASASVERPEPVQDATPSEPVADSQSAPQREPAPVAEDVPTMVGVTDGDRTTSGLAIIRRGDNLWTIARRVYGEGMRYTQIFEANADQIRDPDLIYPGQVFDLPNTDQVVGREESGEGAAE